jgi:DNA invertase Pin-like site-specific DNA recombinase
MKVIAYFRVSTKRQGTSGLGLDSQREAVQNYIRSNQAELVASYTEVESGRSNERPELVKAIGHASLSKCRLVVAKIDRLSRNLAFLTQLMETKVDFIAADMPHANRLTIHLMAAIAEHECSMIRDRTKLALAQAKKRGVKLGSSRQDHWLGREDKRKAGLTKAIKASVSSRRASTNKAYQFLLPTIKELRASGFTLSAIAKHLNDKGHNTRSGKCWSHVSVLRLLRRTT